jgi:hypothetical protein
MVTGRRQGGCDFDRADISALHADWSRYPVGTRCTQRLVLGNTYGRAGATIALAALRDLMRGSRCWTALKMPISRAWIRR